MPLRLSGLIFIMSAVFFALTGLLAKSAAYYGLALMCLAVGVFLIFGVRMLRKRGRRQRRKGKFQA